MEYVGRTPPDPATAPVTARWRRARKRGPTTPLVVLLHGRGADEHDLFDVADVLPQAFSYVSVRAFVPLPAGGYTWFENRGVAQPIPASLRESVARLRAWLDGPECGAESRRCYLFGFSAGMMMAGALLLDEPARFSGGVLLSGALALDANGAPQTNRLAKVPVFYGRGSEDDVIPAPLVARTERYLQRESGADVTMREYPIGHGISDRELHEIAVWFSERR
jgi:phospholipase/carboxylesterase